MLLFKFMMPGFGTNFSLQPISLVFSNPVRTDKWPAMVHNEL
jgi:hypothetical protein